MYKPSSTYRIQFHKDFTFASLKNIIPYLKKIGIDTVYASPIFEASPGSTHGYDCVNPLKINPEIGTEEELLELTGILKSMGIGWLQDIVPNHMAFHPNNSWLMDVLEKGQKSEYSTFFDIDFSEENRLMVPFLGEDLEQAINNGSIELKQINGKYFLSTSDSNWPVNNESMEMIAQVGLGNINKNPLDLKAFADLQFYRLCNWQETNTRINYRRFFTVNSLICLNIQNDKNFDIYHEYILKLLKNGIFQGLRIDHIDGLYDPKQYLDRLRLAVGEETYIVVEKILESKEEMPTNWNAQGSTGYDFLAMMNNLFTNKGAEKKFDELYENVIGKNLDSDALIPEKKTAILFNHMNGELENLCRLFHSLNLAEKTELESIGSENLKLGIGEFLIQMPVYRFYNYDFPLSNVDEKLVEKLLKPILDDQKLNQVGSLLQNVLLKKTLKGDVAYNKKVQQFYQRCMQFTGPLMAKGVEDTVMFTYNRFIGHSEVGDAPDAFGLSSTQFHQKMINRKLHSPLSMNGSSTHDTKRGEDVRARLNVLTDLPIEWTQLILDLQESTSALQQRYTSFKWLHNNDIYLIYQTILGALPMPNQDPDDFKNRMGQYIEKALREAKKRSDWAEPDEDYENKVKDFANVLLNNNLEGSKSIVEFLKQIADFGIINSLSQLLLKCTAPGIPDIYQGTELWDLSLVDPDNRRPVDYKKRLDYLNLFNDSSILKDFWNDRYSGEIKIWLTQKLLKIRKENHETFEEGNYIPLEVKGKYSENIFAFAREFKNQWLITVIPIGIADLSKQQNVAANKIEWENTQILLPKNAPNEWEDLLNNKIGIKDFINDGILIDQLFNEVPVGFIKMKRKTSKRSAGILLHITSLPSAFGIGDFGPEAVKFVDFLVDSNQKYWQILPLNPTKNENGHSPYSSSSALAGNILLISPELLLADHLLDEPDLKLYTIENNQQADFDLTEQNKTVLLKKAYLKFKENEILTKEYNHFIKVENEWLEDFSIFTAIKNHQKGLEWYNWETDFKTKKIEVINDFVNRYHREIEEIKFQQFIFYRQWHRLKRYANSKNIEIIGDLPFYLDRDSAEVWSETELFLLDENLNPEMVAGVPPDYFNDKGQLWGMPIFNWAKMKADHYKWWANRLGKNMQLFDLLRLDHFRAFSAYWEIPAQDIDAVNGTWQPGPNETLFNILITQLGELRFIAEDLGEITEDVEILRNKFNLPGMKVLQFAFGEDLVSSPHIPHNFDSTNCIIYTGTHDNNTLKGWFNDEVDEDTKKRIDNYFGVTVDENNVTQLLARLCYSSIAKTVILTMQDILGLSKDTRMNTPGTVVGNWLWRLQNDYNKSSVSNWLATESETYGRNL